MSAGPSCVLDASALLAFIRDEPGADVVEQAPDAGAVISAVNWAEVLTKTAEVGQDPTCSPTSCTETACWDFGR